MVILDYERRMGRVICDNWLLDVIRYHPDHVVSNPAARFSVFSEPILTAVSPTGMFNPGLTKEIMRRIYTHDPFAKVQITDELLKIIHPVNIRVETLPQPKNSKYQYRNYQERCVKLALMEGRGVFLLPTSSGKSLVIYGIIDNMTRVRPDVRKVLILVPTIQLVKQFHADLLDYGMDPKKVSMYSGFSPSLPDGDVIIANRQWLEGHADDMPEPDMVIIDECHQLKKANLVKKYIQKMRTNIRFGLTGTLPEEDVDVWQVKGVVGPVLASEDIINLQSKGVIANVSLHCVRMALPDKNRMMGFDYHEEWNFVEHHTGSNKVIASFVNKLKGNTLLLFSHVKHGQKLFELVENPNKHLIYGMTDLEDRETARALMESETGVVIVANMACFSTGINIKNMHNIVFGASTKSAVRLCQSIGRGLRMLDGKDKINIIDIHHNTPYSGRHFERRKEIYSSVYQINNMEVTEIPCSPTTETPNMEAMEDDIEDDKLDI